MSRSAAEPAFTFVVGGARSGKSTFALKLAESAGPVRLYVATAQALDAEMQERIRTHRADRGSGWDTLEEPTGVAAAVSRSAENYPVVLIDCLTLWLSNLIASGLDDSGVLGEVDGLVAACAGAGAQVIAVSNEVGLGIVPGDPLSRRFRDLSGAMNQKMAEAASAVYFVASGMPLKMK